MPLRSWAPWDRLTAEDLNAQFAIVTEGRMPGAFCPSGSDVSVAANVATELAITEPADGDDVGGYWQSNGRLVIPRGFGGWHTLTIGLAGLQGAAKGNNLRVTVNGIGAGGNLFIVGATGQAGIESGRLMTFTWNPPELNAMWITIAADIATSVRLTLVRIVRLASMGLYK